VRQFATFAPVAHRRASRRWQRILCLIVGLTAFPGPFRAAAITREEAVLAAREGRNDEAIAALRKLQAEGTDDPMVAFDLAVILTWAKRPREAVEAFEHAANVEVPEFVLAPMVGAYRDLKRFPEAEKLAREGGKRLPFDATFAKLLGLVLADQDRIKEALEVLQPWRELQPEDAEVWLALGYASLRAKDRFGTLRNYGLALRLQPQNQEAAQAMAGVLAELGGPFGAADLLAKAPLPMRANQAGLLVRWGESVVPRDPRRRFEGTDKALARLERLLAEARSARKRDRGLIVRLRRDRIVALRNRERWADAVTAANDLRADGDDLPPYVLEAEADALLALRRPTEARLAYEAVLRTDPQNRNPKIGRFYALIEEENFHEAFRLIDELAASERPGQRQPKQRTTYSNQRWLDGKVLAAQARSFADMPGAAWERIRQLADGAPANAELRTVEGEIAAARGWPRSSDETIHIAASLAPDDKGVRLALAESAMRRERWSESRWRVRELVDLYPADSGVARAQRELWAHDAFDSNVEFRYHYEPSQEEQSNRGASPGSGYDLVTELISPPVAEHLYFVAGGEYHEADVLEGRAERIRSGAGFEWRLPDFGLRAIAWSNQGSLTENGASVSARWMPDDHWTISAAAEKFAEDTPLRAVLNGITADSASAAMEYAWHESRSLRLAAQAYDFSDGNRRRSGSLTVTQKVVDIPHFDLTLRPEIYASENSSDQGPYFSPLRDFSAALSVDAEQMLWRRYERSFGHRLVLTSGGYWQQDFGGAWTGSVLYEQVYQHASRVEIRYGAQLNRSIYDGVVTPSLDLFIRVNLRF